MFKKGLTLTLVLASTALIAGRSFALAPTIDNPGDVIIGDGTPGNNNYVYPDAFDLYNIGHDDSSTSAAVLKWSYYEPTGKIGINGIPSLPDVSLAVNPPNTSPTLYRIDLDNDDPAGVDGLAHTVTFRNNILSPIGGPNLCPCTTTTLAANAGPVSLTLFASDCTTAGMRTILVYTVHGTSSSLSGGGVTFTTERDDTFPGAINGWIGGVIGGNGTTGTTDGTHTGLCFDTALVGGAGLVGWFYAAGTGIGNGYIPLKDGACYRIRTSITSTPANAPQDTYPLLDFSYTNQYFGTPSTASLVYGAEYVIFDKEGGANAPGQQSPGRGRDSYDYWITPIGVLLPQWRGTIPAEGSGNSAFNTREDPRNDMNLNYHFLDADNNGVGGNLDVGGVCIPRINVVSAPLLGLFNPSATPAFGTPLETDLFSPALFDPIQDLGETNSTGHIDDATHIAHYQLPGNTPGNGNTTVGSHKTLLPYDQVTPGLTLNQAVYPIVWVTDKLYVLSMNVRSEVGGEAGTGTTEGTNPISFYELIGFVPTVENVDVNVVMSGFASPGDNFMLHAATPRLNSTVATVPGFDGTQRYIGMWYSHNKTLSLGTDGPDRTGPRGGFFNAQDFDAGAGTTGADPVGITGLQMYDIGNPGP